MWVDEITCWAIKRHFFNVILKKRYKESNELKKKKKKFDMTEALRFGRNYPEKRRGN